MIRIRRIKPFKKMSTIATSEPKQLHECNIYRQRDRETERERERDEISAGCKGSETKTPISLLYLLLSLRRRSSIWSGMMAFEVLRITKLQFQIIIPNYPGTEIPSPIFSKIETPCQIFPGTEVLSQTTSSIFKPVDDPNLQFQRYPRKRNVPGAHVYGPFCVLMIVCRS